MRHFLIDTDTAGDDAIALMMLLQEPQVRVEAVTTVAGNVPLEQATKNALATIEVTGSYQPPVYRGAARPLMRDLAQMIGVHGKDGMGDCDLIAPTLSPAPGHAVDAICELAKRYPDELEILMIGPATNVALALMKEPEAMRRVKHIYSMGTGGFALGMETAVAEFNVYIDAEAYAAVLDSGIPITIAGFDICMGETALNEEEAVLLARRGTPAGKFAAACNAKLLEFARRRLGVGMIPLPDPTAAAAAIWPEVVLETEDRYCYTCTKEEATYGQVIPFVPDAEIKDQGFHRRAANARLIKKLDAARFKEKLLSLLLAAE